MSDFQKSRSQYVRTKKKNKLVDRSSAARLQDENMGRDDDADAQYQSNVDGAEQDQAGQEGEQNDQAEEAPPSQEVFVLPGQTIKILGSAGEGKPVTKKGHPQISIDKFWTNFEPEWQGGVTRILPDSLAVTANKVAESERTKATNAMHSYESARAECIKSVKRIIKDSRNLNRKYTDPHFDLEKDLKITYDRNCINGILSETPYDEGPKDVKRVTEIFKNPQFYKDGAGYDDIIQGALGDCWFLAGISAITANQELLQRVCVIRDQEVGVYGFVFFRDGEWHPTIIDDKLYLKAPAFTESYDVILNSYGVSQKDQELRYIEMFQTGSKSLYYASCRDEDETWVPLLEKAFAKAHGDYAALEGGFPGEALEDLTGGVTSEVDTNTILSKDRFWQECLAKGHLGKDFIFSCAPVGWGSEERFKGIVTNHAYAVLDTYEGYGHRLLKIRNPWGQWEWRGAWSDGSKEWTREWIDRLDHKFSDDGIFWISYDDLLKKYNYMDQTRIFGPEWSVWQQWTRVQVPWDIRDYQQTKFTFRLSEDSETVLVLSQLDVRYFNGLQGQFDFRLQFTVYKDGDDEYVTRSQTNYYVDRATNVEVSLEKGNYTVLFKVVAEKNGRDDIESILRRNIASRKEKVTQVATLYDLAHAKGRSAKDDEEEKKRKEEEEKKKQKRKEKKRKAKKAAKEESKKQSVQEDTEKAKTVQEAAKESSEQPATAATPAEKEETKESKPAETDGQVGETTTTAAAPENTNGTKVTGEGEKPGETAAAASTEPEKPTQDKTKDTSEAKTNDEGAQDSDSDSDSDSEDEEDDGKASLTDPERDPWNASCVVGLRVYAKSAEVLDLNVVVPVDEKRATVLDRDDIAHAALAEVAEKKAQDQPVLVEVDKK